MRLTESPRLGRIHRQAVLGGLPRGGHMLACGARSTVEDLADDLLPGATLTMVDSGAACLQDHIDAARDERFDVIFIDGHASTTCLAQARDLLRDDGRIFLHDAQHPSFDDAKLQLLHLRHTVRGARRAAAGVAWEEVTSSAPLHTMWLPRGYCQIFDAGVEDGDEIVIEHFQASRDLKALVTDGAPMPRPDGSEDFCRARRASRPIDCRTGRPF